MRSSVPVRSQHLLATALTRNAVTGKQPSMDIGGKRVCITGAAARIGAHLAEGLARKGAHVILHYRNSHTEVVETADRCRSYGVDVQTVRADLSSKDEVLGLCRTLSSGPGPIDVLVHNASLYDVVPLEKSTWDHALRHHSIHYFAALELSQWFARQVTSQGVILSFLDAGLHRFDEQHVPYQLSKRSLADLNQMMAMAYAPRIRVNAIGPGPMLPAQAHSQAWFEKVIEELPLPRQGSLDEILHCALFLIENDYVTGQLVYCDGGYHLKGKDLRI